MRRNTLFVAVVALLAMTAGTVAAAAAFSETFEDGNIDGWDAKDNDANISISQNSVDGQYSLRADDQSAAEYTEVTDISGNANVSGLINIQSDNPNILAQQNGFESGGQYFSVGFQQANDFLYISSGSTGDTGTSTTINADTWYRYELYVNANGERCARIKEEGTQSWQATVCDPAVPTEWTGGSLVVHNQGDGPSFYDRFDVTDNADYDISGTVTDAGGSPIDGATVSVDGGLIGQTSSDGSYSLDTVNGTFDVTASAVGYESVTETVTVDGSSVTQDFQLTADESTLRLDVPERMGHNETADYSVYVNGQEVPTVTSSQPNVLQVIESNTTLKSFGESGAVNVTAEVTIDGADVSRSETVNVAAITLEDVTLLPASYALLAILTDLGFVALFAGILISSAICRASDGEDLVCIGISAVWVIGSWAFLEAIPLYLAVMALVGVGLILFGNE